MYLTKEEDCMIRCEHLVSQPQPDRCLFGLVTGKGKFLCVLCVSAVNSYA